MYQSSNICLNVKNTTAVISLGDSKAEKPNNIFMPGLERSKDAMSLTKSTCTRH